MLCECGKRGGVFQFNKSCLCSNGTMRKDSRNWGFLLEVGIYQMITASLFHKHRSVPVVYN